MNSTIKTQLYELISKTDIDLLDIHNIQVKALELNLFGLAVYILRILYHILYDFSITYRKF